MATLSAALLLLAVVLLVLQGRAAQDPSLQVPVAPAATAPQVPSPG